MPFMLLLNLIMPCVMILVGFIWKKYPADMESHNGYNTPASRKSQAHWVYAQSIAPDIFIALGKRLGVIELIICVVTLLLHISSQAAVIVGISVGVVFMLFGFYRTDLQIKKSVGS